MSEQKRKPTAKDRVAQQQLLRELIAVQAPAPPSSSSSSSLSSSSYVTPPLFTPQLNQMTLAAGNFSLASAFAGPFPPTPHAEFPLHINPGQYSIPPPSFSLQQPILPGYSPFSPPPRVDLSSLMSPAYAASLPVPAWSHVPMPFVEDVGNTAALPSYSMPPIPAMSTMPTMQSMMPAVPLGPGPHPPPPQRWVPNAINLIVPNDFNSDECDDADDALQLMRIVSFMQCRACGQSLPVDSIVVSSKQYNYWHLHCMQPVELYVCFGLGSDYSTIKGWQYLSDNERQQAQADLDTVRSLIPPLLTKLKGHDSLLQGSKPTARQILELREGTWPISKKRPEGDLLFPDELKQQPPSSSSSSKSSLLPSGVKEVVCDNYDELVNADPTIDFVLGVSWDGFWFPDGGRYTVQSNVIYLLPALARLFKRYQRSHGIDLDAHPEQRQHREEGGCQHGESLVFGVMMLSQQKHERVMIGSNMFDSDWPCLKEMERLREHCGYCIFPATQPCSSDPEAASPSGRGKQALVMEEMYVGQRPRHISVDKWSSNILACPIRPPTLSSLLSFIHVNMRHGAFNLTELLALAAPLEPHVSVLNRVEQIKGDIGALINEPNKLVDRFFKKSMHLQHQLAWGTLRGKVKGGGFAPPVLEHVDVTKVDKAASLLEVQIDAMKECKRQFEAGLPITAWPPRPPQAQAANSAPPPPPPPQFQLPPGEAERDALLQAPAAVVAGLLKLYGSVVTHWMLRAEQKAALEESIRQTCPFPEWVMNDAIGGEFDDGDEGEDEDMDEKTASAFTDTSTVTELQFMETVIAVTSSRILWFAGSDESLLGLYHHQQQKRCVLLWNFAHSSSPEVVTSSLSNFARGRALREEAMDRGQLGRVTKAQKRAIEAWLERLPGGEGEDGEEEEGEGDGEEEDESVEGIDASWLDWFHLCVKHVVQRGNAAE